MSIDKGAFPIDIASLSIYKGSTSIAKEASPIDEGTLSIDIATASIDKASMSIDIEAFPIDIASLSIDKTTLSIGAMILLTNKATKQVNKMAGPVGNGTDLPAIEAQTIAARPARRAAAGSDTIAAGRLVGTISGFRQAVLLELSNTLMARHLQSSTDSRAVRSEAMPAQPDPPEVNRTTERTIGMKNTVSLGYNRLSDPLVDEITGNIITCMTGNLAFKNPPIPITPPPTLTAATPGVKTEETPTDLTTLRLAFSAAVQASLGGGVALTAAKNAARQALCDALDTLASYVQSLARYDAAMLLSSGFVPTSTNHAQSPLPTPAITAIENESSRALLVRVSPLVNARGYEVQMKTGDGVWQNLGIFPQARRIELTNLTPGTVYTVQVRGIGGSKYYSDWSDPSSHMAT
jgi:Fibronectin type III domain